MKIGRHGKQALGVLQRLAQQEHMLAKAQLMESMKQLRTAEEDQRALGQKLEEHHRKLSETWRASAVNALRNALSSMPYQNWLKEEMERSDEVTSLAQQDVTSKLAQEAVLRGEEKLLSELAQKRLQRSVKDALNQAYKEVDEMVLLRSDRNNDE